MKNAKVKRSEKVAAYNHDQYHDTAESVDMSKSKFGSLRVIISLVRKEKKK